MIAALARTIWRSLGRFRRTFAAGLAANLLEGAALATPPIAVGLGLARLARGEATVPQMLPYAAAIFLAVVARMLLIRLAWRWGFAAGTAATETLRDRIVDHLRRTPLAIFQRWGAAKLASVLIEDCRWINDAATFTLSRVLAGATMTLLLTSAAFWLLPIAAAATLAAFAAGLAVTPVIRRILTGVLARRNAAIAELMLRVGEFADGLIVFRSFNQSALALRQLRDAVTGIERLMTAATFRIVTVGEAGIALVALATPLAIVAVAVAPPGDAALVVPALFLTLAARNALLLDVIKQAPVLQLAGRGNDNVSRLLAEPLLAGAERHFAPPLDIAFSNVTFGYRGDRTPVVHDIGFVARAGEVTAIVGPSGAGKSTIVALAMRYFDPDAGHISIGGAELRGSDPAAVQSLFSMVSQDVYLFRDTLRANILLGDPSASPERLAAAISAAQLDELVADLPAGLDTPLGDTGRSLSGGERQRVAIARALLKDAPIIVLDEATAAMDPLTERSIQQAFAALERGRTVIVVAHRLRTIATADQILVVDGGHIVERGRHGELLTGGGVYARLWKAQDRAAGWRIR